MKSLTKFDVVLMRTCDRLAVQLQKFAEWLENFSNKWEDEHCSCEVCKGRYQKGAR